MAETTAPQQRRLPSTSPCARRRLLWLLCAASVAAGVFYLSITCCAALGGDDEIVNPQNYYYVTHTPLWQVIADRARELLSFFTLQQARFRPFTAPPAKGLSSYFLGDITIYRLYIIAYTYADILLLGALVRKALRSSEAGLAAVCLMPLMFCLWEDSTGNSLYAYGALVQSMLLPVLLAGLCLLRWADTGRRRWAVLGGYCAFHACATFEIGFVYVVPLFGLAWLYTGTAQKGLKTTLPALAGEGVAFAFNMGARACNALRAAGVLAGDVEDMGGVVPNFDLVVLLRTWLMQMSAAFPLNPLLIGRVRPGGIRLSDCVAAFAVAALLLAALAAWRQLPDARQCLLLFLTGLAMLSAPALIIALSPKYQDGVCVDWLHGYIPQVVESFGVGLMALALLAVLLRRLRALPRWQTLRLPAALLAGLFLCGTGVWQRAAARSAYEGGGRDYAVFSQSVAAGLLPDSLEDSLIVCDFNVWGGDRYPQEAFYLRYSELSCNAIGLAAWEQDPPETDAALYHSGISRGADQSLDFAWLGAAKDHDLQALKKVRLYLPASVPAGGVLHYTALTDEGEQPRSLLLAELSASPAGPKGSLAALPDDTVAAGSLFLTAS